MAQDIERAPLIQVLGSNLFERRVLRVPKMSQRTLAAEADVSVNTIATLETARYPGRLASFPQLDTLEKLAMVLDCTVADLLDETRFRHSSTARETSLPEWAMASDLVSAAVGG